MATTSATSNCTSCATLRSAAMRPLYPRRLLLTSMSQALIALSLALSIMTFVISLIEFLPMREGDIARQESLQYNTFICLIVPFILAYCSQSRVISALTQKWILRRMCTLEDCLSPPVNIATKLGDALRQTAAVAGLSCVTGPMTFSETQSDSFLSSMHKKLAGGDGLGSLVPSDDGSFMNSSKLVTTSLTISTDSSRSKHAGLGGAVVPDQLFSSLLLKE
mmetsp:Transcript_37095/g.48745  ORF Transcript_37095/g.48745 Transcript_37095/m.48745 type:complete len:221 (+) Transcript_37095:30-692(+)